MAAFDSLNYDTVLFIAHREEILEQAYLTFSKVRENKVFGRYYRENKDTDAKVLFASVQTLTRHLKQFKKDAFKYIIVDEFHHASAKSYMRIIKYFQPEFLLGLTATPHRLDKKNIFEICDYNLVYDVDLFMAINRGWLVPFRYYGIYDYTVDYNNVRYINGRYHEQDLERAVSVENRADLIFKHYSKYKSIRAIGFCTSIKHAEYMATYFNSRGIKAATIHSELNGKNYIERESGLASLTEGSIQIIFSVDMLNEGVDIPNLDMLLFLRPTQSPVVFLQQLGRGLRKAEGKKDVRVLDFIGNYKKVEMIPFLISKAIGNERSIGEKLEEAINNYNLPQDCTVDFEFQVVDIFRELILSKIKIADKIRELYNKCKEEVGAVPSRLDFFTYLEEDSYVTIKQQPKFNPFKDYLRFIYQEGEHKNILDNFINSDAYKFIYMIENTAMTQLYKMPIFLAFYNNGNFRIKIEKEMIIDSFINFYSNDRNRRDLLRNESTKNYNEISREEFWKLAKKNPMHFLCKTHMDIFEMDNSSMWIKLELGDWLNDNFFLEQVEDAIHFRRSEFIDRRLN